MPPWYAALEVQQWKNIAKKNNIRFRSFIRRSGISFSAAFGIKKATNKFNPDVIHLHDSHAHTFGLMATLFAGVKIPMILSRRVDFPIGRSFLSRWKYNHGAIKKIICVSEFIEKLVKTTVNTPGKVMTIHSGIDTDRFPKKTYRQTKTIIKYR